MATIPLGSILSSLGSSLGSGVGQTLNQGINRYDQNQLRQQRSNQLLPMLEAQGYSPEESQGYSQLLLDDPRAAASLIQDNQRYKADARRQKEEMQAQDLIANLLSDTGQLENKRVQDLSAQQQQQRQPGIQDVLKALGSKSPQLADFIGQGDTSGQLFQRKDRQRDTVLSPQADLVGRQSATREAQEQRNLDKLEKALLRPNLSNIKRDLIKKEIETRNKRLDGIKKERRDYFKTELFDIHKKYKSAQQDFDDLSRLQDLEDEGLQSAGYTAFLKNSGLNIAALSNPSSQEYQKIAQRFVRKAKEYYGGNVTNREMEQFLQTIPSLSQSPEGRKRVIAIMKNIARTEKATFKEARKIIKNNEGIIPEDFLGLINDALKVKRDQFAKKFKKDLARAVPESESPLSTAAAAVGGKLLGGFLKAAPTALGAGLGFLTGGPAGAAVGGGAGLGIGDLLKGLGNRE